MEHYNAVPGQGYRYRNQRFTEHEKSIVKLGVEAHWSDSQIGRALGRSESAVKNHRRWHELIKHQKLTERERSIIKSGIEARWTDARIARAIGRSLETVKGYRRRRGMLKRRRRGLVAALAIMLLASADSAYAHDPSEPFAEWYQSLKRPDVVGGSCCSMARDCQPTEYRMTPPLLDGDSDYEALVGERWIRVPERTVIRRHDNPTGSGVLCKASPSDFIFCFVPADDL
jgi:DNA-binding CsgD family transcriptional regulator